MKLSSAMADANPLRINSAPPKPQSKRDVCQEMEVIMFYPHSLGLI